MGTLCFLGVTVNYVDRANLGVAMPQVAADLHLSPVVQGLALSAFFYAYAPFQLLTGWLVDRTGPRLMLTISAIWWSVCTAATALTRGAVSLIGLRVLLGIGESANYPACAAVTARWFPRQERSRASALYDNGSRVGGALALPLVALLVTSVGWRMSFVVTGLIGVAFAVGWILLYRDPNRHRRLRPAELRLLTEGGARLDVDPADPAPRPAWRSLLCHRAMWALMLGTFSVNFVAYFFITWLPSYLVESRGMSLLATGFTGMLPSLVAVAGGFAGGWVGDGLVARGVRLGVARKLVICVGMVAGSAIAVAVLVSDAWLAVALLSVSYAGISFATASVATLCIDVAPSPHAVGSVMGIQNSAGNAAGIVMPLLVGVLVSTTGGYVLPLLLVGSFALIGAAAFVFLLGPVRPMGLSS